MADYRPSVLYRGGHPPAPPQAGAMCDGCKQSPPTIRQINRRLENGDQSRQIIAWLNTLPKVVSLTKTDFAGQPDYR